MSDPTQTALTVLDLARAGSFAEIREMFAAPLRALVTPEALHAAWAAEVDRQGAVTAVGEPTTEEAHGQVAVRVPVTFERGALTVAVAMTGDGQLVGVQLLPAGTPPAAAWAPPDYADPATFDEQDVTLGTGPLAVPGTLTLPRAPGPHPAVVLLPGSGPNDRDGTIGASRPLKDLAWGLATRGVVVLRFDKVTHAHPDKLGGNPNFTVADEYVTDARAAIGVLRDHPAVRAGRVYLIGHSQGGSVAPRVARDEPAVAGLVLLAGGAQPVWWAAVHQVRYLASHQPGGEEAARGAIDALTRQAELIDGPDLSPTTPPGELPFGIPAPYWLDLRGYHPTATAAALGIPVLVLQGGRDYQATVAEDLAAWRAAFAGRPDAEFRVYDADNHFFFAGSGPSLPAEYEGVHHMDPRVVADIAGWLRDRAGAGPGS